MHTSVWNVDDETWNRFQDYVFHKHRKLRGVLGMELTEALKIYLSKAEEPETLPQHTHEPPGSSKTIENLRNLAEDITSETEHEIPQTLVEKMIIKRIGGDSRTIEKYIHLLEVYGVLETDCRLTGYPKADPKYLFLVHSDAARSIGRVQ